MMHLHFGTGRLGLGLVAPFLQKPDSELYLLNRALTGNNATGGTRLSAQRRNELLLKNPHKQYVIQAPGGSSEVRETVRYHGFYLYCEDTVQDVVQTIQESSAAKEKGVLVTASILTAENYAPVVDALNVICASKDAGDPIGNVYLMACENTLSAREVLEHSAISPKVSPPVLRHVKCVSALVDRMCVGLEEYPGGKPPVTEPSVAVQAEDYGALKLALSPETEELQRLLQGSRVEFSRHLDIEKEIKGWLLNGSHWLIALTAFYETGGNADLKLNEWISESDDHHVLAAEILIEMRDGVEILLRSEPKYQGFVEEVDVTRYLDEATAAIMERFRCNEDTMTRVLARFRTPTPEEATSIQNFTGRLLGRVDPPMAAYQRERGIPPMASTQSLFNLFRLQASGTYVDTETPQQKTTP